MELDYSYVGNDADISFVKLLSELDNNITEKLNEINEKNKKLPRLNEMEKEQLEMTASEAIFCVLKICLFVDKNNYYLFLTVSF